MVSNKIKTQILLKFQCLMGKSFDVNFKSIKQKMLNKSFVDTIYFNFFSYSVRHIIDAEDKALSDRISRIVSSIWGLIKSLQFFLGVYIKIAGYYVRKTIFHFRAKNSHLSKYLLPCALSFRWIDIWETVGHQKLKKMRLCLNW